MAIYGCFDFSFLALFSVFLFFFIDLIINIPLLVVDC